MYTENIHGMFHVIIWQGKSDCSDWFFPGQDFAIQTVSKQTVSMETVNRCVFFCFQNVANSKQARLEYHIYSLRHRKCGVRGFIHELFVSKPERARYERVRAFDTNNE